MAVRRVCCRFYVAEDGVKDRVSDVLQSLNRRAPVKTGEVRPADMAAVIARSRAGCVRPFAMRWGFRADERKIVINARSETAAMKPMFEQCVRLRRCVIPARHYFEWTHGTARKEKYSIRAQRGSALYLAGLYRFEGDTPVFAVLTCKAREEIAFIHDRMPLIFPEELAQEWLDPQRDASDLLAFTPQEMCATRDERQLRFLI